DLEGRAGTGGGSCRLAINSLRVVNVVSGGVERFTDKDGDVAISDVMFCVKATVDFTFSKCAEVVVPHDKPSDIFCLPGGEVILSRLRTVIFLLDAI
ncbi:hypothetical protein OM317_10840, partial [Escherichia albertii]|nr:hypothetical protein [Escherichia albertii]MCZ8819377.1 hypothetical protein [Escherichia albertii]